jgi:hypothetical protein
MSAAKVHPRYRGGSHRIADSTRGERLTVAAVLIVGTVAGLLLVALIAGGLIYAATRAAAHDPGHRVTTITLATALAAGYSLLRRKDGSR